MFLDNIKKFNEITDGKYLIRIMFKIFVASSLDVLSLVLAYSVINITTNNSMLSDSVLYSIIILLLLSIVVRFYVLRTLNDHIHATRHVLSRKILEKFLLLGPSMLNAGLTSLASDIFSEVEQVVNSYIVPLSNLLQSSIVCISISIGLLYLYPSVTIGLFCIFSFLYISLFLLTNKYSKRIAKERLYDNDRRFSLVSNVLNTYKTIAVYGAKESTLNKFDSYSKRLAKNIGRNQTIGVFPKYAIESLVYIGVALYLVVSFEKGADQLEMIIVLGLSAIKLLPSFQTFYHSFNHLRFGLPAFYSVARTLSKNEGHRKFCHHSGEADNDIIKIHIDNFSYGDTPVLQDINFNIAQKGVTSILGESGSGKSTLLSLILGFETLNNGTISYSNEFLDRDEFLSNVGYVPQDYDLIEGTLLDNIMFNRELIGINNEDIVSLLKMLGLEKIVQNHKDLERTLDLGGEGLSGGQKQRISMCRALIGHPKILILDEPTSALDKDSEKKLFELIRKLAENISVIIISHNPEIISFSDKVIKLKKTSV
ncbi:ATP-binding cassette domain-containing protein [Vibrio harveyi]